MLRDFFIKTLFLISFAQLVGNNSCRPSEYLLKAPAFRPIAIHYNLIRTCKEVILPS
jgi:hypothetical protein